MDIDVKYMHHAKRDAILRAKRQGVRVWRIARDLGLPVRVVVGVLIRAGWPAWVVARPEEVGT